MKTINSLRSKLLALTLALVASVSSFAYDEMPDFQVDGLYYNFLEGDNVEVTHPYIPVVPVENVASNTKKKSHAISADDYYNLTNLVIPSTVTYEGKVYKVTRIGFDAFNQCDKLTFVDIPSSVKTIGVGAFNFCSSLTSITLKEGLEHIEWNAFEDCRSLENITFPNSLKTIGNYAFSNTLWYKNHPNGAVYASNVFYKYKGDIPQNTSFVIKEGTVSISPYAFVKENYHEDYSLVSVSIPNSVKVIGEGVFYRCRALTSIVIPDGVTTIETLAFHYCKALNSVTCKAVEPPVLGSSVFSVVPLTDATLYVPAESVDAYKNADQWKDFGQILPIEPTSYKSQWCNQWNILEYNVSGMGIPEETWRYYLAEDITINGTTYTTVNRYWTADKTKCGSVATIRFTENQKVYALLGDTEYLVYDFSVQVGDTIETIVGVNYGTMLQQLLVLQIDIAMPTGPKTITLYPICKMEDGECDDCDEDGHYLWECCPIEWIEGIGSTDGFLMGYPPCGHVGGIGHKLLCAYKDDELQYINELYQDDYGCEYNAVEQNPEDLFPTLWGLQRTTFYHYTECSDSYSSLTASNEIVTINDKPYLRFGKMFLREENNQVLIYSAAYDKDLVLYDWNLEVGDSISLLAMDYGVYPEYAVSVVDYRVIVDIDEHGDLIMDTIPTDKVVVDKISTITLLDGKEYKTWHLATGWAGGITYVEGIGILSEGYGGGDYLGLIRPEELPTCYYGDLLVCVSKNNKLLYQMDPVKMDELGAECLCDYNRGPRKDNAKDGQIGGRPTPTQWNQLEVVLREMDNNHTILQAETFSYTLEDISQQVNNKTYFQLARQSTKDTATTKSVVGALHFGKDEDNRVYFLRDGVEYVLYDFTAEIGDTVEIFAGINNYPQETTYTHVVVDKDTTEDGACRMFLEVVFPDETTTAENVEKVWLAGLGSIDGIVHNAAKRTSNAHAAPSRSARSSETESSVMLCAWREDSCLYTTNHPEYDTFGCVYNQDPTSVESPTSSSSYQKVLRGGQLLIMHNGKTYTVMGIEMK